MKFIILAIVALLLSACDGAPSNPPPKIAAPERAELEKARGIDQILQKTNDAQQKSISESVEK
ncbi:MAG: hypothetical protein WC208_15130 [Gallionella sp.]|jgi:hypothetical protein